MINATEYEWSILEEIVKPGSHPDLFWGAAMAAVLEYWTTMGALNNNFEIVPRGQEIYNNYIAGKYNG